MEIPSIETAELILDLYDKEKTLAKSELLSGINYDGMPKGTPKGNPSTNAVTERINASDYVHTVKAAIALVEEDYKEYGQYLRLNYIEHKTKTAIALEMKIGRATVYRLSENALMEFAKIIPDETANIAEALSVK